MSGAQELRNCPLISNYWVTGDHRDSKIVDKLTKVLAATERGP
jgi:hypothetical protein